MKRRLTLVATIALGSLLLSASAAFAHDGGVGLYGPTDDKVTTAAGFILIIFFPLFVLCASLIQWRLDKRKDARKAAAKARAANPQWRGGW